MRISTKTIFESGMARMNELQSGLVKTQQQISTGRRMLTAADDPVAAARALDVTQSKEMNTQYGLNRQSVKSSLGQSEAVLQNVTIALQDIQTLAISAGNGALDDTQRKYIATELSGRLDELVGLANTRDGSGNYMFGGFQTSTQPFTRTLSGAQYHGDQGQRLLQVEAARQLALGDPGDAVFEHIRAGNGVFTTAAVSGNTGTGVISAGSANGLGQLNGSHRIVFSSDASTYSVFNTTTDPGMSTPVASGTYVSGQAITFAGVQVEVKGAPGGNDAFVIEPSTNQSLFKTVSDLINVLNTPASDAVGRTKLAQGLNNANLNLSNSLDHILTARATVGTRLREIDALDNTGENRNILYAQSLAELQDLDYVQAITELTQTQTTLEAAQKSFSKISGLSLFNYI